MKEKICSLALSCALLFTGAGCTQTGALEGTTPAPQISAPITGGETTISLADRGVAVDGAAISSDPSAAVYGGAPIIYYEAGRDESYGEGTEADGHSAAEAAAHTVITITQPGSYRVSGTLSAGQLAIDLGEDAAADPEAVVTLILDGANITCTVAPAVIFYNVYECGSTDTETATATVDTTAAGASVILADGSENNISGSYVAKIYQEGTDKKLHKYDGAFYSKMSMNIYGGEAGTGWLNLTAQNEGLDAELHLTINGGNLSIAAQNDGINTNEDGVSVTTINGGDLYLNAGLGAEGDGIDSNGYLVINGGNVTALANAQSGEGGLDADMGVYLNGGSVLALGGRHDGVATDSLQPYLEFHFSANQPAGSVLTLTAPDGTELLTYTGERAYQSLIYTSPVLTDDSCTVTVDGTVQESTGGMRGGGGQRPDFADGEPPEGFDPSQRPERPTGTTPPTSTAAQESPTA